MQTHPAFTFVLALTLGVVAQLFARHLRVPGIVLLLMVGAGLGPDGLGWVQPRALGDGLLVIVHLAVAVVLFEGGLNLEISRLRREQAAIRRLVSLGAVVTMLGGAAAVHALFPVSIMQALLFGSLVVVTGPTVIGPLVRGLRLRPRLATVLEAEGVLIDPIGAILAVLMLELALAPGAESLSSGATQLFVRLSFGLVVGVVGGFAIAGLLRPRRLVPEGLENVLVLSCVLLLFRFGADALPSPTEAVTRKLIVNPVTRKPEARRNRMPGRSSANVVCWSSWISKLARKPAAAGKASAAMKIGSAFRPSRWSGWASPETSIEMMATPKAPSQKTEARPVSRKNACIAFMTPSPPATRGTSLPD